MIPFLAQADKKRLEDASLAVQNKEKELEATRQQLQSAQDDCQRLTNEIEALKAKWETALAQVYILCTSCLHNLLCHVWPKTAVCLSRLRNKAKPRLNCRRLLPAWTKRRPASQKYRASSKANDRSERSWTILSKI